MDIFSKILAGDIPCHTVYEDQHALAFLDINPAADGHTLVIPKMKAQRLEDLPADAAAGWIAAVQKVGKAIAEAYGDYNLLVNNGKAAGQVVFYVHAHLIPRADGDDVRIDLPHGELDAEKAVAAIKQHL